MRLNATCWLLLACCGHCVGAFKTGAIAAPQSMTVNLSKKAIMTGALKVPRGGDGGMNFPIKPEIMTKIFVVWYTLNGALGMPAPETAAKDFATLVEGSDDHVVFENLGAISLSYASLVHMLLNDTTSSPKAVALSALPCAYLTYKNMLKGITSRATGSKIHGPISTLFLAGGIYAILSGKGNVDLIAKMMGAVALFIGMVSQFDHSAGRRLSGFNSRSPATKNGQAFYVWYAALVAGWGALVLMKLQFDLTAMEAIGRAAILEILFMVDCIWIRKWNIGVAPDASNYVFLGIPLLTALSIFMS